MAFTSRSLFALKNTTPFTSFRIANTFCFLLLISLTSDFKAVSKSNSSTFKTSVVDGEEACSSKTFSEWLLLFDFYFENTLFIKS